MLQLIQDFFTAIGQGILSLLGLVVLGGALVLIGGCPSEGTASGGGGETMWDDYVDSVMYNDGEMY